MSNSFGIKVIACDKIFYSGRCTQLVLPLRDGSKAIQAHHENMVFSVEVGEIKITKEDGSTIVGVTGTGFAQMVNNRATVIVDTCEYPEEILETNRLIHTLNLRQRGQVWNSLKNLRLEVCEKQLWTEM